MVSTVIITIILAAAVTAITATTGPTHTSQVSTIRSIGSIISGGITHKPAAGDAAQVSGLTIACPSEGAADFGTGVGGERGVDDAEQV